MWGSVNVPSGTTQGADGKSAYEVAIANGFSGTEAQWLASLKGETGAAGATGATGPQGPAGPGIDASTFYVTAGKKYGTTLGDNATAEGSTTTASGSRSHAEGSGTTASGDYSHVEGQGSVASGNYSHAEGMNTKAPNGASHAEGRNSDASGLCSHAEGYYTVASGTYSHAEGGNTTASNEYSHAGGQYNKDMGSSDLFVLGYGTSSSKKNIFRITTAGAVYGLSAFNSTGADYAELFEWQDGNPRNEDRIGLFVTLDGEKVRLAKPGDDFILGVVSGNPSVVGDAYDDQWQGMYATDIFGRFIYEDAVIPAEYDEGGNLISEEHTETRLKINPAYNAGEPYVPRSQRREWVTVGMMGKLTVIDDGTCQVNGWCTAGAGGVATASESRTKYRVMSRLDGNHVRVLIL